ncbi:MAG: Rrf2 family transcriptional regulator [Spirochaetaceae bacterium]|nr:MAG: Rrf2 family transcriptional regulator [Spirochaetaceae bacterium]
MELNKETRQRYEKRMLEVMKEEGDKKLQSDFFTKKIGISRDYVLQLMKSLAEQGLVEFELAKRAPEKKSWVRLKSQG